MTPLTTAFMTAAHQAGFPIDGAYNTRWF